MKKPINICVEFNKSISTKEIYDVNWSSWVDMKIYGPASLWLRGLINDLLDKIPNPKSVSTILDVGCGEGTNTYFIAKRFEHSLVTGIDFSQTGIICAQENYSLLNLKFVYDLESSHLKKNYDLITCFEVLEHVPDWQDFLHRLTTASNKYLMLSFPTGRMRYYEKNVGHLRNFREGEVENFLNGRGFYAKEIYYSGFPFFSPLYRGLCNIINAGTSSFTKGEFGLLQHIASKILFVLFSYCSTKKRFGDQFCGLFEKKLF